MCKRGTEGTGAGIKILLYFAGFIKHYKLNSMSKKKEDLKKNLPEKIDRNAAYHGAAIKVFHTNRPAWDLVVSGSVNEEYPLRVSLVYLGFFVSHLLTIKSKYRNPESAAAHLLDPETAAAAIMGKLVETNCPVIERKIRAKLAQILKIWRFCQINRIPVKPIPYHLRHFIKWCALLVKHAGC